MRPHTTRYFVLSKDIDRARLKAGAHVIEYYPEEVPLRTYRLLETRYGDIAHREITQAQEFDFKTKIEGLLDNATALYPSSQECVARASTLDPKATALCLFDYHELDTNDAFDLMASAIFRHGLGAFLETLKAVRP